MKKTKRIPLIIVLVILSVIMIWVIVFMIINRKELTTIRTFKQEAPIDMYSMTYDCDYYYDEYMKEGFKDYAHEISFIAERLMHGMIPIITPNQVNCSTFVCRNEKGEVLFCRNFDNERKTPCCMVTTKPEYGYKSICATDLSVIMPRGIPSPDSKSIQKIFLLASPYFSNDGMNEHGLAISFLSAGRAVSPALEDAITLNPYDVIRVVLEKAKTVDEAVELLHNYNFYFGSTPMDMTPVHYMIADSTGKSIVVEFIDGEIVVVENQIVTNYNISGPEHGIGQDRYDKIEQVLNEKSGVLGEMQAIELLEKVCMPRMEQYSIIYNLTTGEVTAFSKGEGSVTANFWLELNR